MTDSPPRFRLRITTPQSDDGVRELPVHHVSSAYPQLLANHSGPVWPVENSADAQMLEEIAGVFGATVREMECAPVAAGVGVGEVVGIGEVEAEARLYAHLTGRNFRVVESIDEVSPTVPPEIVLLTTSRLERPMLELMTFVEVGEVAPGIVWGASRADLRKQVLLCSATALLNGPVEVREAQINEAVKGFNRSTETIRVGGDGTPEQIKAALGTSAGVLVVSHHGDGWRILLGDKVAFCRVGEGEITDGDADRAPPCAISGHCEITDEPIAASVKKSLLLGPSCVSARIFLSTSCTSVMVDSPLIDGKWGYLPNLIGSHQVGCVVATPDLSTYHYGALMSDLVQALVAGVPVGRAVAGYLHASDHQLGHRLLIFGDPKAKGVPGGNRSVLMRPLVAPPPAAAGGGLLGPPWMGDLNLFRNLAFYIRSGALRERAEETSQRLLAAIGSFEDAMYADRPPDSEGTTIRAAVIDHLATMKARVYEGWFGNGGRLSRMEKAVPCPYCNWQIRPFLLTQAAGTDRTFMTCPACGDVVDKPLDSAIETTLKMPKILLKGHTPGSDWDAAVVLVPVSIQETKVLPWPTDDSGSPRAELVLDPPEWPKGVFSVKLVLLEGTALSVVGGRAREPSF